MPLIELQISDLKKIVNDALGDFYNSSDKELIKRKLSERTLVFRLGLYLENRKNLNDYFKSYDLDIEYNKNDDKFKKLPSKPNGSQPDIILHKRGNNWNNVLVIEVKKHKNYRDRKADKLKLKEFTSQKGSYKYEIGVFIILGLEKASTTYFIDGKEV